LRSAIHLSQDSSFNSTLDPVLGLRNEYFFIPPGDTISSVVSGVVQNINVGDYLGIGRPNVLNAVSETDYSNNITMSGTRANVDVALLPLEVVTPTVLADDQPRYFKVEVGENLDLKINLIFGRQCRLQRGVCGLRKNSNYI
jgi:hypothetical protein